MKRWLCTIAAVVLVWFTQLDQRPSAAITTPLLVVTSSSSPFSAYYGEILRAEGLNAFTVADIGSVSSTTLNNAGVVLLAETPLTQAQADMFSAWVTTGGGRLIAARPDKKLASLLGLTDVGTTLSNAYMKFDTTAAPGQGLVADTIQFHGAADIYVPLGATTIAALYTSASAGTTNPAVTSRTLAGGGRAAAFTFDPARSVVYTRQGNPAWAGSERDGFTPIRPDDLFFGAAPGDFQPDWVDLSKVAIPQADELQRLLANLIELYAADRTPLPRFWYFPNGYKAAVIMTGDDHGRGGTVGRFAGYEAASTPGCSVADWQCIRSTSYVFPGAISDAQAAAYTAKGFEVALHLTTLCQNWTPSSLQALLAEQLSNWRESFPSLASPTTIRTHCLAWSDYDSEPQIELANGMRLDTTYYYWPPGWVLNRPGFFTGSGMPMRFARADGGITDVYQAVTQMTDESQQTYPFTIDSLLDRAVGPEAYYGAFTANMHTDDVQSDGSDAIIASATARGIPVVSSRQMLQWLDGRNASSFGGLTWNASTSSLTFTIAPAPSAVGLLALVPASVPAGGLTSITRDGIAVAFTTTTIKGISYASVPGLAGSYRATYSGATVAPDTFITAGPPALTNAPSATFSFSASTGGATFACGLDGAPLQACATPKAYGSLTNGVHTFRVAATSATGLTDPTPATLSWTVDTTRPAVSVTAPAGGSTLPGTVAITATANDNTAVAGVQFRIDGVALGAVDSAAPYSIAWNTTTAAAGAHSITAVATDTAGNTRTSAVVSVTVNNPVPDATPPTVSISSPAGATTVSGTITVTATASDNVGVAGVQFRVDGAALGAEDVSAPFSVSWTTTTATNASHVLTAVARDAAGNATTSAAVTVTVDNAPPPPTSSAGLVAAYAFDEASGSAVLDLSGNANNGTLSNATRVAGHSGGALAFNGTNALVTVADSATLRLSTAMTLEAWVNPSALGNAFRTVVMKQHPVGGLAYVLYVNDGAPRPSSYAKISNVDQGIVGTSALPLNTWTHIATTYDGTTFRLWVNGALVAAQTLPGEIAPSFTPLFIGGNQPFGEYFSGLIDDVRIYSRALTVAEIQSDMATPVH